MEDVRFTEKKIDEGWKHQVGSERQEKSESSTKSSATPRTIPENTFSYFLTSLATQALVHLGEIENPLTKTKSQDLNAAKEIIDLLIVLKQKTTGNLTVDESKLLSSLIADLQIRFAQAAGS